MLESSFLTTLPTAITQGKLPVTVGDCGTRVITVPRDKNLNLLKSCWELR